MRAGTASGGDRGAGGELRRAVGSWRGSWLATGAFSFCINVLMLTVPLYMMQVYDRVLTSRSESTLVALTILAGSMLLVMGLLDWIRARVMVRIGTGLDSQLSGRVFDAGFAQSCGDREVGRSQSVRDLDTVRQFLTGPGPFALFDAPWMPIYVFIIYLLHPNLGMVAMLGAAVLVVVAHLNEIRTRPPVEEASAASSTATGLVETSLRNAEVLKALGMHEALGRRWRQHHERGMAFQAQASDRAASLASTSKTVRLVLQVAILGIGASLAVKQLMSPGAMIAASILMGRALAPVELAISQWRPFLIARAAFARLEALLEAHPVPAESTKLPAPKGRLEVEDLVAGPPGSETAVLSGVAFSLEPGETLGVIGPTAAGKSTLARHLAGVWEPLRGSVRIDGAELRDWHRSGFASHMGYLPQDVELFSATVAENIARLAETPDSEAVVRAAMRAGAHEMILRLPDGYETRIGVDGSQLSGGQRQRIGLARALYGDPVLVVLDEPNANLDAEGDKALAGAIRDLKASGSTVIVMVHRPAALAAIDKVLVLGEGRVQQLGSRDEVLGPRAKREPSTNPQNATPRRPTPRRVVQLGTPETSEASS